MVIVLTESCYIKQDACSGVNSACKAGIIISSDNRELRPRNRDFYRRHLRDTKLYRNTVRFSAMQGMPQNPNHKIDYYIDTDN